MGDMIMDEYLEMLFACAAITTGLGIGVLILHGCGVFIMWLRDIRTGKKRLCVLRRVL
jgi:hypothetical protein